MKKKIISVLMVAVILTATIPLDFLQLNIDNKAKASGNTVILDDGRVVTLPPEVPTQITVNGNTYPINKELLADSGITSVPNLDSGIAVYGTPNDVKNIYSNDYDSKSGEWRYLGFDINANKYSNPDFPPDADSGRSPSQKNWQSLDYIYKMNIEHPSPYNDDSNAGEWLKTMVWVRDIERGGKTPDEYDPIWLAEHFHILSPPTEYTAGLARGWHKSSSGKLWYQTFVMPPLKKIEVTENPPSITADFQLKNEVYEYQDVGYKDTSFAEYSTIEYRKLTITGDNGYSNVIENSTSPTIKLKEGNYTFTLEVRNNAGQTDTITKNITIIKQQEEVPSKAIAIINGPNEVPINQNFTVTGEGSFPSTGAKIIEFKWYIGTDPINLIHSPTYDNQSSIYVSYSTEGDRYFKLWIKDSAGKEAWSNIHYTKINSGIVASAKAKINVPSYGYEGVPFSISTHGSYVTVEGEKYSLKKAVELGYAKYHITGCGVPSGEKLDASGGMGIIYELGDHDVNLRINPKNGNKVKATDYITILSTPVAQLTYYGELKENRLIVLDASNSAYNRLHPYVPEKTYLVIKNLDTNESVKLYCGQSIQNDYIKSLSFNDLQLKCIFAPGNYQITFYTEDDRGNFDTDKIDKITIKEDMPPKPIVYSQPNIFRNPDTKKALIELESKTKSIDSDYIDYKEYYYKFDDDNDGSFNDESWQFVTKTVLNKINFEVSSVGNYLIREVAKEKFSSDTIETFVTENDRKESIHEFEIEVNNKEPIASTLPIKSKNIDVMINYDVDKKTDVYNTVDTYENNVINDEGALLKPNTYLNSFQNGGNDVNLISSFETTEVNSYMVVGENDKYYLLFENRRSYINTEYGWTKERYFVVDKETGVELCTVPPLDVWQENRFNRSRNIDMTNYPFLGNSDYIWYEDELFNVKEMKSYPLPEYVYYNLGTYFDEDKGLFYYSSWVSLYVYDINNHTYKKIIENGQNPDLDYLYRYSILSVKGDNIYLIYKYQDDLPINSFKFNIKIITIDHDGNTKNISQQYSYVDSLLDDYYGVFKANSINNLIKCIHDNDDNRFHLTLELELYNENASEHRFQYVNLVEFDTNGNINKITNLYDEAYYYNTTSSIKITSRQFFIDRQGNFVLYYQIDNDREIRYLVYTKQGNVIDYFIHEANYDWVFIDNPSNGRFIKIFEYNYGSFSFYNIYDVYEHKYVESLSTYYHGSSFGWSCNVADINNSEELFIIFEENYLFLYDALNDKTTKLAGPHDGKWWGDDLRYAVKHGDKIFIIFDKIEGNKSILVYNISTSEYKLYSTLGSYGKFYLSSSYDNLLAVRNNIPNLNAIYALYNLNLGFFKIIDDIKGTPFNNDDKYFVVMSNENIEYTNNQKNDLVQTINSKNGKVIWFGNSSNDDLANDIINNTGGYFKIYGSYSYMMAELADVLKQDNSDLSDRERTIYIKKGESINYERIFADYENDSKHIQSGEKWLYIHDPSYFSNNDGLASFHNVWLTEPVIQFDKVGKYTVTLKLRDNPVGSDDRFDNYRKWSSGINKIDIIVYDDDSVLPPVEPDIPLKLNVDIVGDLRVNHRVDFIITATKGSNDIDWNSLDISFDKTDYLPNTKPNTLEFSRVFTQIGEHNITVTLKDVEGNPTIVTVPFTINDDLAPVADFNLTGDGKRNELGIASFKINDISYSNDDEIGTVKYYIESTKYIDNGDGTYSPSGTEYYPLEFNEFGEIELDKIGLNKIKQVVTETYVNGIGLNGEDLDKYRVFESSEIIKTVNLINEAPQVEYIVTPNIVKAGDSIEHITNIKDDTPSGDYAEYMFIHDETYFQNSQGKHGSHNIITEEPTEVLNKKGKYDFYVKAYDEDGASTNWIHGGQVIVASEPIADFELVSPDEIDNDVFKKGSIVTIENKAYNEDYGLTVPNHGIEYIKVEYKNIASDSYTTIFESDSMPNYISSFNLPQINKSGIYEVKMTVRSPEGFEATATKQFTVLDLRLNSELTPSTIYASQSYKVKAKLSIDGLGAVAYIPYNNIWITLDKVSEDMDNKYYEKEITTDVDLADGIYDIEVYGVYPYNNELKEVIPLTVETPLELISDIKPIGPIKYINIIEDNTDSNDYIQVPAGEKIQITADVTSPVTVEYVKAQLEGESEINLTYNSSLDIYEGEINIPAIKLDKDYYVLSIETSTPNGNTDINNHRIKVDTPVDLIPDMPSELTSDTTATIRAETSKYVETLTVTLYKGESFKETLNMTVDKIVGNKKEWVADYHVPTGLTEGTYIAEFRAETYNGNIEIDSEDFKLFSLDLKDLRITHIYNHPYYEDKYPILYNDPMVPAEYKTGYYITFKINAKGSPDLVKMRISFFGYDKEFNMKKESENGTESVWKLEWYADSFTPFGTIINTQVTAYKGENTFNFNDKYNWNGDFLKITGTIEQDWRIDQEF